MLALGIHSSNHAFVRLTFFQNSQSPFKKKIILYPASRPWVHGVSAAMRTLPALVLGAFCVSGLSELEIAERIKAVNAVLKCETKEWDNLPGASSLKNLEKTQS